MKLFCNYWNDENPTDPVPTGSINGGWFAQRGLPMVVACTCCGMTMGLPSAWITDDGECYCSDCRGE